MKYEKKRVFSLFLVFLLMIALLAGMYVSAEETVGKTPRFVDVGLSHWASAAVETLSEKGILSGIDENHFCPSQTISRAQYVAMVVKALKLPLEEYAGGFSDVKASAWYAKCIETAVKKKLVAGTSTTTFSPDKEITREQIAVMIMNAYTFITGKTADALISSTTAAFPFKDADEISSWALSSVKAAHLKEFINGMSSDKFVPKAPAKRDQAAYIMLQLMNSTNWGTPTTPKPKVTATPVPTTPAPTATPTPPPITKRELRVAVTCVRINKGNLKVNLQEINKLIDKTAIACQPDIIVLSEAIYHYGFLDGEAIPGNFTNAMAEKCKQYNCYIAFNMLERTIDGKRHNTNILLDRNGNMVGKYYKIKIPSDEAPFTVPGTEYIVFNTEFGKIGMEVCYDLDPLFGGEVSRKLAENGAELILASSLGEYWQEAKQAAIDNKVFVAIAGQMKYRESADTPAPISGVFGPDGTTLAGCEDRTAPIPYTDENAYRDGDGRFAYADIDLGRVGK